MLSPLDIETKQFGKTLGGYNRADVDDFMRLLLQDYKELYMNNLSLKDKLNSLTSTVTKYKSMEDVLQNTLVVAQLTSDDVKKNARDRAKTIVDEAENHASSIILDASRNVSNLEMQLSQLKLHIANYRNQLSATLKAASALIETLPSDVEININNDVQPNELDAKGENDKWTTAKL